MSDQIVTVTILGKSYQVKCPREEASQLREAAAYLDKQIHKLGQPGQSTNIENLAVVAALNISQELLLLKTQKNHYIDNMHEQIKTLQGRIQQFLGVKEEVPA